MSYNTHYTEVSQYDDNGKPHKAMSFEEQFKGYICSVEEDY